MKGSGSLARLAALGSLAGAVLAGVGGCRTDANEILTLDGCYRARLPRDFQPRPPVYPVGRAVDQQLFVSGGLEVELVAERLSPWQPTVPIPDFLAALPLRPIGSTTRRIAGQDVPVHRFAGEHRNTPFVLHLAVFEAGPRRHFLYLSDYRSGGLGLARVEAELFGSFQVTRPCP